ncbi:hypothetical protein HK096_005733 [Nowakowskiella sp. JEL0078]|nr:hypothetical protein HK096_005733 [Nowakowskiella sp. JEL0078]
MGTEYLAFPVAVALIHHLTIVRFDSKESSKIIRIAHWALRVLLGLSLIASAVIESISYTTIPVDDAKWILEVVLSVLATIVLVVNVLFLNRNLRRSREALDTAESLASVQNMIIPGILLPLLQVQTLGSIYFKGFMDIFQFITFILIVQTFRMMLLTQPNSVFENMENGHTPAFNKQSHKPLQINTWTNDTKPPLATSDLKKSPVSIVPVERPLTIPRSRLSMIAAAEQTSGITISNPRSGRAPAVVSQHNRSISFTSSVIESLNHGPTTLNAVETEIVSRESASRSAAKLARRRSTLDQRDGGNQSAVENRLTSRSPSPTDVNELVTRPKRMSTYLSYPPESL